MENDNHKKEPEINLVQMTRITWRNRKFILKVTGIFAAVGLLVAIFSPKVYVASCTMVPQTGQKSAAESFGGLAAMAGIKVGNLTSKEVLSPYVYPMILGNVNFKKELIYSKYHFEDSRQPITLYDYYTDKRYRHFDLSGTIKKYTIGLPGVILGAIKGKPSNTLQSQSDSTSIQSLTEEEKGIMKTVSSNLSLELNDKDGYIILSAKMDEPVAAAEMAQRGQELLQKYITEFKIEKVANNLAIIEKSFEEAKENFEAKQEELARFRDANKSFTSAVAKTQEEKLSSEYTLLLSLYTELAKQKEQAKIAVTETTPILTVIAPVVVPTEKLKPRRSMIFLIYTFIGFFIGAVIVLTVSYLEENYIPDIKDYRFIPKIY